MIDRAPKVRTSHHRNKEEAARLQVAVDKRFAADEIDRLKAENEKLHLQLVKCHDDAIEECAKIVESRMIWWRNSHDQRIRDGSENKLVASEMRDLKQNQRWPSGCHDPDSCARHQACMYVQCRRSGMDGNDVAREIAEATRVALTDDISEGQ